MNHQEFKSTLGFDLVAEITHEVYDVSNYAFPN